MTEKVNAYKPRHSPKDRYTFSTPGTATQRKAVTEQSCADFIPNILDVYQRLQKVCTANLFDQS